VATTRTALKGARGEIVAAVTAFIPRSHATQFRFRVRSDDEMYLRPIRECAGAGAERLCEVSAPIHVEGANGHATAWVGSGTVAPTYEMEIRMLYPSTPSWAENAADDAERLRDYLFRTASVVDGVQFRDPLWPPTDEAMTLEPWFLKTIRVQVLLDVTP
jgi:hypothetical protein